MHRLYLHHSLTREYQPKAKASPHSPPIWDLSPPSLTLVSPCCFLYVSSPFPFSLTWERTVVCKFHLCIEGVNTSPGPAGGYVISAGWRLLWLFSGPCCVQFQLQGCFLHGAAGLPLLSLHDFLYCQQNGSMAQGWKEENFSQGLLIFKCDFTEAYSALLRGLTGCQYSKLASWLVPVRSEGSCEGSLQGITSVTHGFFFCN